LQYQLTNKPDAVLDAGDKIIKGWKIGQHYHYLSVVKENPFVY